MSSIMRRVRPLASIALLVWCADASMASAAVTIRDIPPTLHYAPARTSLDDLGAAIKMAATESGWHVTAESTGTVQVLLTRRTHEAVVNIGFDESKFWIDYQDSINLDYNIDGLKKTKNRRATKGPRIHRNYNVWVDQLAKRIAIRLKLPPRAIQSKPVPSTCQLMVADELEKLDALRVRGILSQEEFDQQKAKLLAY